MTTDDTTHNPTFRHVGIVGTGAMGEALRKLLPKAAHMFSYLIARLAPPSGPRQHSLHNGKN